jgi:hypothetical protein
VLFVGILLGHGIIVLLLFVICIALAVNYILPPMDAGDETPENPEDGVQLLDCEPAHRSEPSIAGPSSSGL